MRLLITNNFLICLTGLPASGKSTFALKIKEVLEERFESHKVVIIDPDKIRDSLSSGEFDYSKEQLVRKENLKDIKDALRKNKIVISDDINYYTSMRRDLRAITNRLKLRFFIVYISTPIEKCREWNERRGMTIPSEVIEDINKKFDIFDNYSWDSPLVQIDMSLIKDVKNEAEKVLDCILREIEIERKRVESKSVVSDEIRIYKERLDKISRELVGDLLKNPEYSSLKKKIIGNRKVFINSHSNHLLDDSEIVKAFKEHYLVVLNIKIP